MITPRQTRVLRVPDLQTFQQTIAEVACHLDMDQARACAVIVPSRAAAAELRHTLEHRLLIGQGPEGPSAVVFPDLVTREDWYGNPHSVWGVVGGMTEIARDLPNADDRLALESAAGKVMEIAF